jgi:tetratricopeptide (TPR) repeat protein
MRFPTFISLPRKLPGLFLLATLIPVIALVWLGWRLLDQDSALENQRILERLEDAADLIAAAIDRRIAGMQDRVAEADASFSTPDPPGDVLIVRLSPSGLDVYPPRRLLFRPQVAHAPQAPENVFKKGELSEYRNRDYAAAAAIFRRLARSADPLVRAGALVRLARNLRKAGRNNEALSVYEELAYLGSVPVGQDPAELVGLHARCALLYQMGKRKDIVDPALRLYNDLQTARWRLTRASYEYYTADAKKWLGDRAVRSGDIEERIALADAVDSLWQSRSEFLNGTAPPRGRRSIRANDHSFLLVWNRSAESTVALVAGAHFLASEWKDIWDSRRVGLSLIDGEGHSLMAQSPVEGKLHVVRPATDTGLPWTLRVSSLGGTDAGELAARRRILISVLAVMALAVLACGYFTSRGARAGRCPAAVGFRLGCVA